MRPLVWLAATVFIVLVVRLHWLRPDVDPVSRGISRYAAGPNGYVASAAFAALVLACAGAAWLLRSVPWVIAAVGLTAVMFTPLGLEPAAGISYAVHQAGALIFFIAATWAIRQMNRATGWAATLCLLTFLANVTLRGPWLGLLQRALFVSIVVPLLMFRATPESPSPRGHAHP